MRPNAIERIPVGRSLLVASLLVALTCWLYWDVGEHGFIGYDDENYLTRNVYVNQGLTWSGVRWAFLEAHAANWHPLTWMSHMLDYELFGSNAGAHHLVSAGLHAANGVLCYLVLLVATRAFWPSVYVAALFLVHPLRVQSVAWASERKDVLAAFFFFLCLLAYIHYARKESAARFLIVLVTMALGLMAKPMLVTLPVILLFLDRWPLERAARRSLGFLVREKLPLVVLALISSVFTVLAQKSGGSFGLMHDLSFAERSANAASACMTYIGQSFWPRDLAYFHPHPAIVDATWSPIDWRNLGAGLALVILTALVWRRRARRPYILVGWLWFLAMLAPVIGILQVGEQSWAERYAYLPTIGLFVALAWAADSWVSERKRALPRRIALSALAVISLLGASAVTSREVGRWRDSKTLFTHALKVTENNYVAHIGLGNVLREEGDFDGALAQFTAARSIRPNDVDLLTGLSNLYSEHGRTEQALEFYAEAIEIRPRWPLLRMRMGIALARLGRMQEALEVLQAALARNPDDHELRYNLALVQLQTMDTPTALENFSRVLELAPGFLDARIGQAEALLALGRHRDALAGFERVAELEPEKVAARLAWILSCAPSAELRDGKEAQRWGTLAVTSTQNRDWRALEALAAALAEQGRFQPARKTQREALLQCPKGTRGEVARRLQLYVDGKPYRIGSE